MGRHAHKLRHEIKSLTGKNWSKGSLTNQKLMQELSTIASFCASRGLQSIRDMGSKEVNAFFASLQEKGLSNSTMANYATAMRTVAAAIAKNNIVPRTNRELGFDRSDRYNPKTANVDKMQEIQQKLTEKHQWLGLACQMQQAFGLRLKESLLSNKVYNDGTTRHLVVEGAKGGRPRSLPIDTAQKAEIIEKVHSHLTETGGNSIIPADKDLKQGCKAFSNAYARAGGTKATNTNAHLWRHQSAQDLKEKGKSDKEVAEHLGHGRERVVSHYC